MEAAINALQGLEEYSIPSSNGNIIASENNEDFSKLSAYEGAIRILAEKRRAMKTRELLDEVIRRGKKISATNKLTSFYSSLYKAGDGRVKKDDKGMWYLTNGN